jgi:hypothetical protein
VPLSGSETVRLGHVLLPATGLSATAAAAQAEPVPTGPASGRNQPGPASGRDRPGRARLGRYAKYKI